MDGKTYKLWAEFFRQAAEGQARFDEVRKWLEEGMRSSGGIQEAFRKWFEATTGKPIGESAHVYEEAVSEFNRIIRQFFNDFGVVPRAAYKDLEEKNRALKQRIEEQEESIRRLRRMLADREIGLTENVDRYSEFLSTQQDFFKQWMDLFRSGGMRDKDKEEEKS